jgi:hypothetical protein
MAGHRYAFRQNKIPCKSFDVLQHGDAYIELIIKSN